MDNKGGRYTLEINGSVYSGRGTAKIDTAGVSVDNGVNMDSTMYSTVKPELITLDLTLDRRDQSTKWDAAMMLSAINVTFAETDAGLTHVLNSARWQGKPTLDTSNGEISGLKVQCAPSTYTQLTQ